MSTGSHETLEPGDKVVVWGNNGKWGMKGVYEGPAQADSRRVIARDPHGIGFDVKPEKVQKIPGTGE